MLDRILGRSPSVHIDMTPMVDVMMLLVIFFMMSTVFITEDLGLTIQLPGASGAKSTVSAVTVLLDKDGRVAVDGQIVSKQDLSGRIAGIASGGAATVTVKADKAVSHGQVVEVMDLLRKAGVVKLSIAVSEAGTGP